MNRLSLGIQSFDPRHLRSLGRIHDADEARRAAESALMIFGNVNLDLMFALPEQTLAECEADIAAALAFGTPHLSFYQLTLEPNTLFHRHPPPLPDDDLAADMQQTVEARLAGAGYARYEVSAYAKAGRTCAHNLNYWRFGDYLGIGAGAHAKLSFPDRIVREVRWKQPRQYLEKIAAGEPAMERREVRAERSRVRVHAERAASDRGRCELDVRGAYRLSARDRREGARRGRAGRGLLEPDPSRIAATELGRRFLNRTIELFLPETPPHPVTPAAPITISEPHA